MNYMAHILGSSGELILKKGFSYEPQGWPDAQHVLNQFHVSDIYHVAEGGGLSNFKVIEIQPKKATDKHTNKLIIVMEEL